MVQENNGIYYLKDGAGDNLRQHHVSGSADDPHGSRTVNAHFPEDLISKTAEGPITVDAYMKTNTGKKLEYQGQLWRDNSGKVHLNGQLQNEQGKWVSFKSQG